jgi:hypothetical protein
MAEFTLEEAYGTPTAKPKQRPYTPLNAAAQSTPVVANNQTDFVPQKAPLGLTPKALNEFNLQEANRIAAARIRRQEEDRTGAGKAPEAFSAKSKKLKDFEGFLTEYKTELDKDLMVFPKEIPILPSQGLTIPLPVGSDTARMNSKYTALLMGLKDAYELGALTGPDMGIVEAQITNPASISGAMTSRDAMKEQVKVLEGILKRGKENLESSYGRKMDAGTPQGSGSVGASANDPLGIRPRKP